MTQRDFSKVNFRDLTFRTINDPIVHYAFGRSGSEEVLTNFINAVLSDKGETPLIDNVTIKNPFDVRRFKNDKQIVVDIRAEDKQGRTYDVEFQVLPHTSFMERCLYYWGRIFDSQIDKGTAYNELSPVTSIILTDFQLSDRFEALQTNVKTRVHSKFMICERDMPEVVLTDCFRMHVIQLPKTLDAESLAGVGPELSQWLKYFGFPLKTREETMREAISQNGAVATAFGDYVTFQEDPQLRELAKEAERNLKDIMDELQVREDKGRTEGSTNTAIEMIKQLFTMRFGSLDTATEEALNKKAERPIDQTERVRLTALVMNCASPEDFRRDL